MTQPQPTLAYRPQISFKVFLFEKILNVLKFKQLLRETMQWYLITRLWHDVSPGIRGEIKSDNEIYDAHQIANLI